MRKLAYLLFLTATVTGCGKKAPLIYPEMLLPAAPSDISVQQTGDAMKLAFVVPSKDQSKRKLTGLSGIKILKRDEPAGQSTGCNSCTSDFSLYRTLYLDAPLTEAQRYGGLIVLLDSDVQAGRVYTYRATAFTKDNQDGMASAPVMASMVKAPPPPVVHATSQPTEIHLEFSGGTTDTTTAAGYNVYRTQKDQPFPLLPLNGKPQAGKSFIDHGLDRGVVYRYGVRTVVRLPSGGQVESILSNEVEGRLKDDE